MVDARKTNGDVVSLVFAYKLCMVLMREAQRMYIPYMHKFATTRNGSRGSSMKWCVCMFIFIVFAWMCNFFPVFQRCFGKGSGKVNGSDIAWCV